MKTRNGFVSNSSSTSFVIWLPKGFNASWVNFNEQVMEDCDVTKEQVVNALNKLYEGNTICEYDGVGVFHACSEILKDFVLTTNPTQSDDGEIIPISTEKINEIRDRVKAYMKKDKNGIIMEF